MSNFASKNKHGFDNELIFRKVMKNEPVSERELLVSGILPPGTNKAS
jgi:hypothetical protein